MKDDVAAGPLWQPSEARAAASTLTAFAQHLASRGMGPQRVSVDRAGYQALHDWSVAQSEQFWPAFLEFSGLCVDRGVEVLDTGTGFSSARWFEDSRLNYAENLLQGADEDEVLVARDETGARRSWTRGELRDEVHRVAQALTGSGVVPGDVVAGLLPNAGEAVVAMLATAAIGATWTSMSPDFGVRAIVERIGQVRAKVLFATTAWLYAGKRTVITETLEAVIAQVDSLQTLVLVDDDVAPAIQRPGLQVCGWGEFVATGQAAAREFTRFPFNHPLFILYSSGTTGLPKAILHGAGGSLLQHVKEHRLHVDLRPGDRVAFFTTCGWMMWNWLVSALASGCTVVLYDGSPLHPGPQSLWELAESERLAMLGVSPRYLAAIERKGYRPRDHHALQGLRSLLSTGAPLTAAQFRYVYDAIGGDLHLASISGGTDILSCFLLGVPWLPVEAGELQAAGLGMDVAIFSDEGADLLEQRGELVCRRPFPSMPLGFVNDQGGLRFHQSYFARFPGVWHHGDYAIRKASGAFVIEGRSDAVLNPGGVRIGTAELYRVVEQFPEVLESLATAMKRDGDERLLLFLRLADGVVLDVGLERRIRQTIAQEASRRHVPWRIVAAPDLPRTYNGKLAETAVRKIMDGSTVENRDALANPEVLDWFIGFRASLPG